MKSRKAQLDPLQKVGGALLVIALVIIMLVLIIRFVRTPAEEFFGERIEMLADSACKSQGQLGGRDFEDKDGDKRPDLSCDNCIPGDNDNDKDNDGVPDACDYDAENNKIGFCYKAKQDCSKSKCCDIGINQCGPNRRGEIRNIGTEKDKIYQCKLS